MRIIVTHASPDLDAITSAWLIRKFLPGWDSTEVRFVPAGERLSRNALRSPRQFDDSSSPNLKQPSNLAQADLSNTDSSAVLFKSSSHAEAPRAIDVVEIINGHEVIHVDTGLGPLDHHQTASDEVCGASLTWEYIKAQSAKRKAQNLQTEKQRDREQAISRMVKAVVDIDHFKEVFWEDTTADYHEFSLLSILDGLKLAKMDQDEYYVDFVSECLDAILHEFENRIWAEKEIAEKGIKFDTRFGKGMGFETINDTVLKLAQKMGYVAVIRKDPRKGYVRIKAMPSQNKKDDIDLTLAYEKLKKMDPSATWFLHIGKKMLLNGSVKNPKMRPTRLSLLDIIKVLEKI
ncbi:MAG: hypothetical protein ACD_50C00217G0002 [uncultured bacterium]|nr:MAG: hypothetical protein ACD_50C00217G0002 [uncultured bacterium]OGH13270.1 MAG: hypothetical protein A2687_03960 [Candidatus Levybacteria bacterium RIFCSPHIGHO2_01_FULL_38_26]